MSWLWILVLVLVVLAILGVGLEAPGRLADAATTAAAENVS